MAPLQRSPRSKLWWLCLLALGLSLGGCVNPWRRDSPSEAAITPEQAQWWAANSQLAEYVPDHGYRVPGAAGYFDANGRPLTPGAGPLAASKPKDSGEGIPIDGNIMGNFWRRVSGTESADRVAAVSGASGTTVIPHVVGDPAPDLSPEQAQWWLTNRHLARWVPGSGFQIAGIDGAFDASGHISPRREVVQTSATTPIDTTPTPGNTSPSNHPADSYDPTMRGKPPTSTSHEDGSTMTAWDRVTGKTEHDSDDDSWWSYLPWVGKTPRSEPTALAAKAEADAAFQARRYEDAAEAYAKAAASFTNSNIEEDALFMRGESLFFADLYPKAFDAYQALLVKYVRSRHLEKAVAREFAIGQYWFLMNRTNPKAMLSPNLTDKTRPKLDTLGSALKAMEKVRLNDPTGPLADDSLMSTAGSYFERENYQDADYYYTLVRREYPKSEHQFEAHVLGIQAKVRAYQGAVYEGKPLKEAGELIDQTLAQFKQIPADERQRLLELKERLTLARAERDWTQAQYYEQQEYFGAARFYYQQLIKDYPGTQVERAANERLDAIKGKPATPAPKLTFISGLIQEPEDPKRLKLPESAPTVPPQVPQQAPSNGPR